MRESLSGLHGVYKLLAWNIVYIVQFNFILTSILILFCLIIIIIY